MASGTATPPARQMPRCTAAYAKLGGTKNATRVWFRSALSPSSAPATRRDASSSWSYVNVPSEAMMAVRDSLMATTYYYVLYVFDRSGEESAGVLAQGPEGRDAPAVRLRRPPGHPLLLSEGRYPRLHAGDVRVSSTAPHAQAGQGGRARRQHSR